MFNDFNWGGYLLFRLWPHQRVFIDSQSDFYGEQLTREAAAIEAADAGWEQQLLKYDVGWMILPRSAPLAAEALHSSDWQVAYEDGVAVILRRR
jgi:hypothetical protein